MMSNSISLKSAIKKGPNALCERNCVCCDVVILLTRLACTPYHKMLWTRANDE